MFTRSPTPASPLSQLLTEPNVRGAEPLMTIVEAIRTKLEKTPPELAADIIESGIVLTGGGSLMLGLDKLISSTFGVNCYVAEDAVSCVAIGAGKCLDNLDYLDPDEPMGL